MHRLCMETYNTSVTTDHYKLEEELDHYKLEEELEEAAAAAVLQGGRGGDACARHSRIAG